MTSLSTYHVVLTLQNGNMTRHKGGVVSTVFIYIKPVRHFFKAVEFHSYGFLPTLGQFLYLVLRHFCNVLLYNNGNVKQNIAEMSQDAS